MHRKLKLFVPKVTRLCDLTNDNDTVTSVSWAERGNFVAVGTHRGYVQVIFASSFKITLMVLDLWDFLKYLTGNEIFLRFGMSLLLSGSMFCQVTVPGKSSLFVIVFK